MIIHLGLAHECVVQDRSKGLVASKKMIFENREYIQIHVFCKR